jgi:hypothetical protein
MTEILRVICNHHDESEAAPQFRDAPTFPARLATSGKRGIITVLPGVTGFDREGRGVVASGDRLTLLKMGT